MRHCLAATGIAVAFASIAPFSSVAAQSSGASGSADQAVLANDALLHPSQEAVELGKWILATADAQGLPFIVVDKIAAEVFLFNGGGQLVAITPALLGITPGDDSAPGIGERELSQIPIEDRTTPAGRFIARFGPAAGKQRVLWVDFATAVSLHPVVRGTRKERRLQRLKSPSAEDNRITFGCINVDPLFYSGVLHSLFEDKGGVVYILPEKRHLSEVFPAYQRQGLAAWERR
jgi:hypothetical protein